jgi:hypothetical protein
LTRQYFQSYHQKLNNFFHHTWITNRPLLAVSLSEHAPALTGKVVFDYIQGHNIRRNEVSGTLTSDSDTPFYKLACEKAKSVFQGSDFEESQTKHWEVVPDNIKSSWNMLGASLSKMEVGEDDTDPRIHG